MSANTSWGNPRPLIWFGRPAKAQGKAREDTGVAGSVLLSRAESRSSPDMMPNRTLRKAVSRDAAPRSEPEGVTEYAVQLRRIGDKWDLRQRILNLISKLFCPGT